MPLYRSVPDVVAAEHLAKQGDERARRRQREQERRQAEEDARLSRQPSKPLFSQMARTPDVRVPEQQPRIRPKLAEGQTAIPLARSAAELPMTTRLQGPSFEGAAQTVTPGLPRDPRARLAEVDRRQAEYERLNLTETTPHGEPPFPGYERGAKIARGVGGAVGGTVGLEGAGEATGEFAYRAIVPKTPAEFASAFATGGLFGETTVAGRAIRRAAQRAGMRVEAYVATPTGKALMQELADESGALRMARGPEDLGGAAGAERRTLIARLEKLIRREDKAVAFETKRRISDETADVYRRLGLSPHDEGFAIRNALQASDVPVTPRERAFLEAQDPQAIGDLRARLAERGRYEVFQSPSGEWSFRPMRTAGEVLADQPIRSAQTFETPPSEALGEADAALRAETGIPASEAASSPGAVGGGLPEITTSAGIETIAKRMRDMVVRARKLGPEQARMISEQKAARVQGAAARLEKGGGLPAFHESKSFLAGEYDKPIFEPPDMPPEDVNAMVDFIGTQAPLEGEHPEMFYFRQLGALTAIEKWTMGIKPANNELDKLDSFIPSLNIKRAFEEQAMSGGVRGLGGAKAEYPPDYGAEQLHLRRSDPEYMAAQRQADVERSQRMIAEQRDLLAKERAAYEAWLKKPDTDLSLTWQGEPVQGRLGESTPEFIERVRREGAETAARMRAERLQQIADLEAQGARQAESFEAMQRANLPSAGMQTRLADAINESYVGAIAAGKGTPVEIGKWTRRLRMALSPLAFVKTLKTSFDVGWGGRQGWRLMPRNPREWWSMYGKQFRALKNEKNFAEMDAATRAFPNFERSQSMERPLAYLQRGTGSPETSGEEFLLTKGQDPITDAARWLFNPSERAYVAPGNWMRQAVLDKQVRRIVKRTGAPVSDADFQLLIDNLNNATLRGNTKWLGNANAQTLASVMFSLKGQVSGPQFMADALRAMINGGDAYSSAARQIVAEQVGAYIGAGMATLGLAAATGYGLNKAGKMSWVSVDLNKDSKTFGEISVGGFRWNYWGSDAALVRYALAVTQGKRQEAAGLPSTDVSRLRLSKNFAGAKIAPGVPRALWVELVNGGYDPYAQRNINTKSGALLFALDQIDPLFFANTLESYKDLGPATVLPSYLANVSGLSTSTWDTSPTEKQITKVRRGQAEKQIKASGYREIGSDIWRELQGDGSAPKVYATPNEMRDAIIAEVLADIERETPGTDPLLAQAIAERVVSTVEVLQAVESITTRARESFLAANPAIAALLVQIGERSAGVTLERLQGVTAP